MNADGGVAIGLLVPATAVLPPSIGGGGRISIDTWYPYADHAKIRVVCVQPFTLQFRVPGWAGGEHDKIFIAGREAEVISLHGRNSSMIRIVARPPSTVLRIVLVPAVRLDPWGQGAVSVHRGSLMFSLPLRPEFSPTWQFTPPRRWQRPAGLPFRLLSPFNVTSRSVWRKALVVDSSRPLSEQLKFRSRLPSGRFARGLAPFNHSFPLCSVRAMVRELQSWPMELGGAALPPPSPACLWDQCGPVESIELVPHGATVLRIGMLPLA